MITYQFFIISTIILLFQYDYDQDDQIPIKDFMQELRNASDENIPILMIEKALKETDVNDDGIITLGEFLRMVK